MNKLFVLLASLAVSMAGMAQSAVVGLPTGVGGMAGRTVTGTTDSITSTDLFSSVTYNSASPVAVSLPFASSFATNFAFAVGNLGAGTVTITPTSGTINGLGSLAV